MDGAGSRKFIFFIVLQQKDLGVGAAWIMATMFFIWTTLKRTVHSSTQVLSATPKQKFMVLLLGSAALLVPSKSSAAQIQ